MLSHFDIIAMKDITLRILDMECAACVSRLDRALLHLPGVSRAAASYASSSAFISFDENELGLGDIAVCVKKAGFRVPVEEADIRFEGKPEAAVKALTNIFGVKDVSVHDDIVTVFMWPVCLDTRKLTDACADCGLAAEIVEIRGGDEDQELEKRMELLKTLVTSAACTAPLMLEVHPKLQFLIGSALQFIPGRHFYRSAARELRSGFFGMDLLVSLSSTLIYAYSSYVALTRKSNFKLYFTSDGVLLSLILFGKYMEQVAAGEASSAIRKLMRLQPRTAMVKRGDKFEETSVDKIRLGDIVLIRPGERVPADGIIVGGRCAVDESMLTGESLPVDKSEGNKLIGGSLNRAGSAELQVTALGKATVLEQIIDIVRRAQSEKAPVQRFADSVAHWFVPSVIGAAAATFAVWYRHLAPKDLERAVLNCCDVLSVACPCALGLATPTGLMVGSGAAAERGILFRSGTELENAYKADCVVFDKTGTLTQGVFMVTAVHPETIGAKDLLHLAAHAENYSTHPIASALRAAFSQEPFEDVKFNDKGAARSGDTLADGCHLEDVEEIAGKGIRATVNGHKVCVGNERLMEAVGAQVVVCEKCRHIVGTTIHVAVDGAYAGHIIIADKVKDDSREAVAALKQLGVDKTVMLTGDHERVAVNVAESLGIDEYHAELMPQDKVAQVERLLKEKPEGRTLGFVGDGINDAPVLARADVGIAMGSLGSDAAIEAADVVLMDDKPSKIATAIRIARKTIANARQNTTFAIAVKVLILILVATGLLGRYAMPAAVFGDVGVMVLCVLNAMRTLRV